MDTVINFINKILWGSSDFPLVFQAGVLGVLLVCVGLYLTIRLRGIQFRHFAHMISAFIKSIRPEHADSISGFQAFSTSLAARVGAGNISGVAIAITLGGPGAVFWMWVVALVGMATAMVEATLAQVYKQRDEADGANVFRGGPAYTCFTGWADAGWACSSRCCSSSPSPSCSTRFNPTRWPAPWKTASASTPR